MDLELIFFSIIFLRTANWEKWTKFFKILLALVLAYQAFILIANSFTFLPHSEWNIFTFLPLKNSSFFREHFFRFQLRHHNCLIKPTSLQLHHRTSLMKLTSIASLHHNYNTCSKLTLHHSTLLSHSPVFIHLQIRSGFQLPHLSPVFVSAVYKYVPSSMSNYIWNTSKLLFLSDDVETNPGLRPINQDPAFISIYSNRINRRIQEDMAPKRSDKNCNAQCHQACNGLSTSQTRHAKNCGRSITWKCLQHGTGITKIVTSPPPIYEFPSRRSAVGKSCSVCKNPIRTRYADLAYHCANPSCDNVCHLAATFSGFVNPRTTARAGILSTPVWHCHLHTSPSASGHPSTQHDTSPSCPTPPSLKSLLNQGLSLADAKSSKEKCAKCCVALCSNTVPARCSV